MLGDGEKATVFVGGVFVRTSEDDATALLAAKQERVESELQAAQDKIVEIEKTLAEYKVKLKAKFKDSINLDE